MFISFNKKGRHLSRAEQIQEVGLLERGETQRAFAEALYTTANVINSCGSDTMRRAV